MGVSLQCYRPVVDWISLFYMRSQGNIGQQSYQFRSLCNAVMWGRQLLDNFVSSNILTRYFLLATTFAPVSLSVDYNMCSVSPRINVYPRISMRIATYPRLSPFIAVYPHVSPCIAVYPCISPRIATYPCVSPHIPVYPHVSPRIPEVCDCCRSMR